MNFGDILDQWEKKSGSKPKGEQRSNKKANAPEKKASPEKKNTDMTAWLNKYGVVDKDSLVQEYKVSKAVHSHPAAKNMPIDATIDLHNFTQEDAWRHLDTFVRNCKQRGFKKVLIIHGKGIHSDDDPVLGRMVRMFIEQSSMLGASGHPKAALGGSGATWVMIK